MGTLFSVLTILLATLPPPSASYDKAAKFETDDSAVISGTVSVKDAPAAGITIALMPGSGLGGLVIYGSAPIATTTTDGTGHFRLSGLAAGSYQVIPLAPVMVAQNEGRFSQPGKSITLAAGEVVEGININLVPGGVITGKVTGADGAPVIQTTIALIKIVDGNQKTSFFSQNFEMFQTDDRGVYRVYGVPPGQYEVCTGINTKTQTIRMSTNSAYHTLTYYPSVTDETQAKLVEVSAGGEASNIDITVGKPSHAFAASGRIIDAQTSQPVSGVQIGYGTVLPNGKSLGGFGVASSQSDNYGGFRIDSIMAGHYAAFGLPRDSKYYSDSLVFDVSDTDVSGLEIKLNRGASISGTVVVDGVQDPAINSLLSLLTLSVNSSGPDLTAPNFNSSKVNSDGSFHVEGIHPGLAKINIGGNVNSGGFSLLRVEQEGATVTAGVQVDNGADIQGLKVVMGYSTGAIRGTITIASGTLPPGAIVRVLARRLVDNAADSPLPASPEVAAFGAVDARGRFLIQGLLPGEYELTLNLGIPPVRGTKPPVLPKQTVTVTDGATADAKFVVNLGGQP